MGQQNYGSNDWRLFTHLSKRSLKFELFHFGKQLGALSMGLAFAEAFSLRISVYDKRSTDVKIPCNIASFAY